MNKEHLVNKRHLEKMEETKTRKYICPDWLLGHIGHIDRIPKRCRLECKNLTDVNYQNFIVVRILRDGIMNKEVKEC